MKWECVEGEEHWGMKFLRCKEQDGVVTRDCARRVRNTLVLLGSTSSPVLMGEELLPSAQLFVLLLSSPPSPSLASFYIS